MRDVLVSGAAAYLVVGFLVAIAVILVEERNAKRRRSRGNPGVFFLALMVLPVGWLPLVLAAAVSNGRSKREASR